ncbi:MAG: RecQ family ATP-dependent DNA helicase [Cyclobacteriaceae bacterium]|nr:RecQ family ATP-dependent DNA helicase [Cyclobacteriaceae bacterium]
METPEHVLKQYWGYDQFRLPQADIINNVLKGRDTVALLPTGGGKSVCFQVPALIMEGICLVITPLIALMEDQVSQLKRRGIAALAIHSGMSRSEIDVALDNCSYGKIKFLYLSPERIQTEMFQARVQKMHVNLIAIDEAHCISQWGYDFRPSYLLISDLRELKPEVPVIALTATATKKVKDDIIDKLSLKTPGIYKKSFARENLSFVVRKTENKEKLLLQVVKKVNGAAIVYVRSRRAAEKLSEWLTKSGVTATYYHAGLTYHKRSEYQKKWIEGETRVVVATNAFGMGIDKANVRTVIHMDIPETLEAYYQEAGRAGRDGKKSYAVVICHPIDVKTVREKVEQSQPEIAVLKKTYQALSNYLQLAEGSAMGESFDFDLITFSNRYELKPIITYAALKKLEEQGLIQLNESFYRPSKVHFLVEKKRLYEFQVANDHFDHLIKGLLRLYGGELFSTYVNISESQIGRAVGWNMSETKIALDQLHKMQLLDYEQASEIPQITFLMPRQDADRLPLDKARLEERRNLALTKMEAMIEYVEQSHRCRTQFIQSYFDEETFSTCGVCDVCLDKKKKENQTEIKDYHNQILLLLKQRPMTSDELEKEVNPSDQELLIEVIREMLDANEINYDEFWVLRIT